MKKYYVLLGRDNKTDNWDICFGDYKRSVVEYEKKYDGHGYRWNKIIITSDAMQSTIIQAVKEL